MAYGEYRGQCVGRLLRFLYYYAPMISENAIFHPDGKITDGHEGPVIAEEVTWNNDGDGDIPHFKFSSSYNHLKAVQDSTKQKLIDYEKLIEREPYSLKTDLKRKEAEKQKRQDVIYNFYTK